MEQAAVYVLWGCLLFAALGGPLFTQHRNNVEVAVRLLVAVDGLLYFCFFALAVTGLPLLLAIAAALWLNIGVPWWLAGRSVAT